MSQQYYDDVTLTEISDLKEVANLTLLSTDSYSDHEVYQSVRKTLKKNLLLCAAIQTSIVGLGNKTYGHFTLGPETFIISDLYKQCKVKTDSELSTKLQPGDLTPRRLQRLFRKQIHDYLVQNVNLSSYLWRKYSTREEDMRTYVYPGAESFVKTAQQANYLLETYSRLDKHLNTMITVRIQRVLSARGII
jgi:hypothetical protein